MDKNKLEIFKLELESQKLQKEIEKIEEEKKKVQAEKNELIKSWYFKPVWWTIISTFLLGFGGFYVALQTNIFGIQELKVETKTLKDSIIINKSKLKSYKDSLNTKSDAIAGLESDFNNASIKLDKTFLENKKLLHVKNQLTTQILEITRTNNIKIQKLKGIYEKETDILKKQAIIHQLSVLEGQNSAMMKFMKDAETLRNIFKDSVSETALSNPISMIYGTGYTRILQANALTIDSLKKEEAALEKKLKTTANSRLAQ